MISLTPQLKRRPTNSASEVAFDIVRPLKITFVNGKQIASNSGGDLVLNPFPVRRVIDSDFRSELIALSTHCGTVSQVMDAINGRRELTRRCQKRLHPHSVASL
jgi:hypothetical protein